MLQAPRHKRLGQRVRHVARRLPPAHSPKHAPKAASSPKHPAPPNHVPSRRTRATQRTFVPSTAGKTRCWAQILRRAPQNGPARARRLRQALLSHFWSVWGLLGAAWGLKS